MLELTEEVSQGERREPTLGVVAESVDSPDDTGAARREPVLGLRRREPEPEEPTATGDAVPMDANAAVHEFPTAGTEASAPATPEPRPDMRSATEDPPQEESPSAPVAEPAASAENPEEAVGGIVSQAATAASANALGELTRVMDEKTSKLKVGTGDTTIADLVKEMLRPMMREWLDENLPVIVERVVRREIQKLVDRAEDDD